MSEDSHRIKALRDRQYAGTCVIYRMSRDQRAHDNHALLSAQKMALKLRQPLVVVFNLKKSLGVRAHEHATFMIEGLEEVASTLKKHAISFIITPEEEYQAALHQLNPSAIYFDFSPLKGARSHVKEHLETTDAAIYVVDTHNIIPVWVASDKQEYAAHTFRRKVHKQLATYLKAPGSLQKHPYQQQNIPPSLSFANAYEYIHSYPRRGLELRIHSGEHAAKKALDRFIEKSLDSYALKRNDIAEDHQSGLSPYFHFGQLSSLRVALEVLAYTDTTPLLIDQATMASAGETPSSIDGMNALFEEMIVRKELSDNFCLFSDSYTTLESVPEWAQKSLQEHTNDPREHLYSRAQLEEARTHDEIWNAAQRELTRYGKMHGYMRMYWAKKILEWSPSPEEAVATTIYLNDAYSIDGGDPNGYVGILWSIGGLHDRPWTERPIFGSIRYMNAAGLKRKFDTHRYIKRIHS